MERFGRIDVALNQGGNFYAACFEELTPERFERQLTNLIAPLASQRRPRLRNDHCSGGSVLG